MLFNFDQANKDLENNTAHFKMSLKERRGKKPARSLADCIVPAEDSSMSEEDYIVYWQHRFDNEIFRPVLAPKEIGCVKGASGVYKTTYLDTFIAGAYVDRIIARGVDPWNATSGYRVKLDDPNEPWACVHADTEQSKPLFYKRRRSLYHRISGKYNGKPENYMPMYLKGLPMQTKFDYIEQILESVDNFGAKTKFLYLDHPRDFVNNPNDGAEAIKFVENLEELQEYYGFTMLYAFHCNSTSSKMDGHIGSQMNKKNVMELYLSENKKERGIINVDFEKLRDAPRDFKLSFAREGRELHMFDPQMVNYGVTARVEPKKKEKPSSNSFPD